MQTVSLGHAACKCFKRSTRSLSITRLTLIPLPTLPDCSLFLFSQNSKDDYNAFRIPAIIGYLVLTFVITK